MFKYKFHQQTKFLCGKIKLVWLTWFFLPANIFLPNFVASNYQKVIADIWIIFVFYSFHIGFSFFWSLDPCPPKILDARLDWSCCFRKRSWYSRRYWRPLIQLSNDLPEWVKIILGSEFRNDWGEILLNKCKFHAEESSSWDTFFLGHSSSWNHCVWSNIKLFKKR